MGDPAGEEGSGLTAAQSGVHFACQGHSVKPGGWTTVPGWKLRHPGEPDTLVEGPGRGFQAGLLGAGAGSESDLGTIFWSYTLLAFICLLGLDLALGGPAVGQSRDQETPPNLSWDP